MKIFIPRFIRSAEDHRSFCLAELAGFDNDCSRKIYSFFVHTKSGASSIKTPRRFGCSYLSQLSSKSGEKAC